MDLRMPVLGGLDATRLIKDACPTTLRLVLHQTMVCRRSLLPPAGSSPVET
jgi:CheY-like chemotaxis protein